MSKQTAVDYLFKELSAILGPLTTKPIQDLLMVDAFQQAKAMEREQIVEAWNGGDYAYFYSKETGREFVDGSEYYNEIYKGGSNE